MIRALKIDFAKMFGGFRIYACILAIAAGFMMYALQMFWRGSSQMRVENLFSSVSGGTIILLYMLCVAGGSFFYCVEEKNGCLPYEVQRGGLQSYTMSKTITSSVGGFVTAFIGQILTLAIFGFVRWLMYLLHYDDDIIFAGGLQLYNTICSIILTALYCSVLSVVAFLITTLIPNYFVAVAMPLLLHYLMMSLFNWITPPKLLNVSLIYMYAGSGNALFSSIRMHLIYALFFCMVISGFVYKAACRFIGRRLERG